MPKELGHDYARPPITPECALIAKFFVNIREAPRKLLPVAFPKTDGQRIAIVSPFASKKCKPFTSCIPKQSIVFIA
jgi:hypothetical protein